MLSQYSLLRGSSAIADWGRLFRGLWGRPQNDAEAQTKSDKRGGNYPASLHASQVHKPLRRLPSLQLQPPKRTRASEAQLGYQAQAIQRPWAILADEGDLCGIPAALEDWGARSWLLVLAYRCAALKGMAWWFA